MTRVTNDHLVSKLEEIEEKLPNGELQKISKNVSEIKKRLEIYRKF